MRAPLPGPSMRNVERLDLGAIPQIESMQANGLLVDLPHFSRLSKALREDMERLTEEAKAMTGQYTLLSSGDQVAHLLFHTLGLKQERERLTQSGDRESVEEDVLVQMKHQHPVVPLILEFKQVDKIRNTYADLMPGFVQADGRIRPNYRTTRAATGRLSCNEPNLMAIPVRSKRGKDVRRGFIAPHGWVYVSVDLSQIEMRVSAHHSGDANLIRVYENEEDIYSDFATTAFNLPDRRFRDAEGWHYPTVDRNEHRSPSKTCVLGVMYGVSAKGLLDQMPVGKGWDEDKCQGLIDAFYRTYPEVHRAALDDHSRARRFGYVWDMFGRIRHIPEVRSMTKSTINSGLRQAANLPIQAGAQGIIKLVMAETQDLIERWRLTDEVKPLLQIHDELLFECRESIAEEWTQVCGVVIENCCPLRVPILWSGARANTWGDLEK